ncbi:MAG: membrane protein insertion efficiency factor YidD [Bacteroidetes bacterium]|nr:MAG: membrane protein insertion efficiency factor YidD [Bacteroidota bacterium]
MHALLKKLVILPIRAYQVLLSPLLGPTCRYQPTCSHYMVQAIEEWGVIRGLWLGVRRIFRCHPWGGHGYDPVPRNPRKEKAFPNKKTDQ